MSMLPLALKAQLPLIHVTTDDLINVEDVLSFIAPSGAKVFPVQLPEQIPQGGVSFPKGGKIFYTSSQCKTLVTLYRQAVDAEVTVVFVNTEKSVLMFDGGVLFPPADLVLKYVTDMEVVSVEEAKELMQAYGGLTLKDVGEVSKLTMTRDESLSVRGINETRRNYAGKNKGIEQVDTKLGFYVPDMDLSNWIEKNRQFFLHPVHPSLVPRGLLFDGPPGTGKTMGAKAIAQAFDVALYRLDLGSMMGKYVGESEANLMAALSQVDQVEPCVILFDEVEKIWQGGGGGETDSGVSSRLLSQLLWWLQEHKTKVLSVLTTNNVGIIPKELYRPGRIDATMMFEGIHNKNDGVQFALQAFDAMAKEVGLNVTDSMRKTLMVKAATKFDGKPVPQVQLTQIVFELVKEFMTAPK